MEAMLSVKHLVKRFGGLTAVNDVSLDLYPGEVLGLVGDNAAGNKRQALRDDKRRDTQLGDDNSVN